MSQRSNPTSRGRSALIVLALSLTLVLVGFGDSISAAVFSFTGNVHNWMSPAYTSPFVTADDLLQASMPTSGGVVFRFVPTSPPAFQFWDGTNGNGSPKNFPLEIGEGYSIIPRANEVVNLPGNHTPAVIPQGQTALPFIPAAGIPLGGSIPPGIVALRDYLIAIPWTTTMNVAEDVRVAFPGGSVVTRCEQRPSQPPAFFFWTGSTGNDTPKNYTIDFHQSYVVRSVVNSGGTILP